MSVLPENGRRYASKPDASVSLTQPLEGIAGVDGESYERYGYLYSGGPDVNPLLAGRNKYLIYQEMRRSSPVIKALLLTFKLPLRAAPWSVQEASQDPIDLLIADAVSWQFGLGDYEGKGRLDLTWDEQLQQKLLMLDWGSMFEEDVWSPELETWIDGAGNSHDLRALARVAPRAPHTIIEIQGDDSNGRIAWLVQDLPGAQPIPGEKLSWYVLEREGKNWWGTSLLRSCYGPWRLHKQLSIAVGIAWDRWASGTPVVRYPEAEGQGAKTKANQIGRNVRTHERAYVSLPGPKPQPGIDGWDIEIIGGAQHVPDPTPLIRHFEAQIAMAGLQQFTSLGRTETGSRAVGEVQSELFYMAVQGLGGQLAEGTTKMAIRRFVDVNFGTDKEVPKLVVGKIQGRNIDRMATAIANLAQAGFYMGDLALQNALRDLMELPELPDPRDAGSEGDESLPVAAVEGLVPQAGGEAPKIPGAVLGEGGGLGFGAADVSSTVGSGLSS